ncbi:MAG: pentapeptide repeat-containing protein [Deltaproteobacteria bacterium]|nr:pentapeptide repeat-containing protein [Deltaproteobacteria bacterium]
MGKAPTDEKKLAKLGPKGVLEKEQVASRLGLVKGVRDFLADGLEMADDLGVIDALEKALPWAEVATETIGEALPPIKILLKLFSKIGDVDDPGDLGYLAATLAYQRAVEQALPEVVSKQKVSAKVRKRAIKDLRAAAPPEAYKFDRFSFESATQHQFVKDADRFLEISAESLGLDEAGLLKLQHQVHIRFVPNLKGILSHGKTREKFAPFRDLMALDTKGARAQDALLEHADYQRWLFEERPVLGREPFSLGQVYVDTDCGVLSWKEIKGKGHQAERSDQGRERIDPFLEKHGGRHQLVETVLGLIADEVFKDAIVLQGVAGSGKSSLTLRLAWELAKQGLRPIRIELKHLDTGESASVEEALPEAVHITATDRSPEANKLVFGKSLFLDNSIFDEDVQFRGTKICPYVLILDGWDEISVGASEGYRQQLERMLAGIRRQFLEQRAFPVRVILTGRPTDAVEASKFLRDETQILTVRNLSPDQLEGYVGKVRDATSAATEGGKEGWSLRKVRVLPKVLKRFQKEYSAKQKEDAFWIVEKAPSSSLEIFGLPLLAHLALRLLAERPLDAEAILEDTTSLFRSLVDLVIGQAGKPSDPTFDVDSSAMLRGIDLRKLLRRTAEAMTLTGAEAISHDELEVRLSLEEDELSQQIDCLSGEQVLSRLMISFFFKGGRRELGAEFSHKSFREYLFAEQVVEELKAYGRLNDSRLPEKDETNYWKDFEVGDPRRKLCHRLAELFGPVWITPEVSGHVRRLLDWEINRVRGKEPLAGQPTEALDLEGWERARDGLAQAWDWWGEGVHLRPQPTKKSGYREYEYLEKPVALQVVENVRLRSDRRKMPTPPRIATIDAHLGDGLLMVTALVHYFLARLAGFKGAGVGEEVERQGASLRYQRNFRQEKRTLTLFAPSGPASIYFFNYCARINAGGYRPLGVFPRLADLSGADLRNAYLGGADLRESDLSGAHLSGADLRNANLGGADLGGADLSGANLSGANLSGADLRNAYLGGAGLGGADLRESDLGGADLRESDLSGANLSGANLSGADLRNAYLGGAGLREAKQLTQEQVGIARGSTYTELPPDLVLPAHWTKPGEPDGELQKEEESAGEDSESDS